jgi:hypothetical protein
MDWSKLNRIRLGKYAEYLVKTELLKHGIDVYSAEVDDKGIDLVLRRDSRQYYDVQVKSARGLGSYIFFPKDKFELRENLYASIVLFQEGLEPSFYLIPSLDWRKPTALLRDMEYEGLKSRPEYGVNVSKKNPPLLEKYRLEDILDGWWK